MDIPHLCLLFKTPQHQSRRQGRGVAHRLNLRHRSPSFATIPNSVVQETGEDRIPDQSGRTPLLPKSGSLNGLSPNTIGEEQVRETVVEPTDTTHSRVIGVPDCVRRMIPNIARTEHDLRAQWSITVASETCLCPKSYLLGSRIRSSRIPVNKRRIGGNGTSDLPRRSLVDGAGRVTPNPQTEGGSTRSKLARVRHFG